jgi:uncharacterized protein (TIGR02246 family)
MRRFLASCLVPALIVMAAGCAAPQPEPQHPDAGELIAVEAQLCEAYRRGDATAIAAGLTDDYTLINGRGELSTRRDDVEDAQTARIRYSRFHNRDMQVRFYGTATAVVTGYTEVAGTAGTSHAFELTVRFTDTFVKVGTRWLLAAGQASGPVAVR